MDTYVTIFGSYRAEPGSVEYQAAYDCAYQLAQKGYIILNGGGGGIMKASTEGANAGGTKAIGVVLENLYTSRNSPNDEIHSCKTLFERLEALINKSEAYIVFSGGTGTLAELTLTWELMNKRILTPRPLICFGEFWRPVVDTLKLEPSYSGENCTGYVRFARTSDEIINAIIASNL